MKKSINKNTNTGQSIAYLRWLNGIMVRLGNVQTRIHKGVLTHVAIFVHLLETPFVEKYVMMSIANIRTPMAIEIAIVMLKAMLA
jgi:hypothetical protein